MSPSVPLYQYGRLAKPEESADLDNAVRLFDRQVTVYEVADLNVRNHQTRREWRPGCRRDVAYAYVNLRDDSPLNEGED